MVSFLMKNKMIFFRFYLTKAEFCGLTVRDLDFKNEVIRIDHQLQRTRGMKYEIVSTKTTMSIFFHHMLNATYFRNYHNLILTF